MEKVIPDTVLETMVCRSCDKYLTVGPIGIHCDGGNVCGRCLYKSDAPKSLFEFTPNQDHNNDEFIPLSLLGYINYCFPCINRYEGCKVKLPFGVIRNHELYCIQKNTFCGNCNYIGVGTQLLHHFTLKHPHLINKRNTNFLIELNSDLSLTFLVKSGECVMFIKFVFIKSKGTITFGPNRSLINIREAKLFFTLNIYGNESHSSFNDNCLIFDNNHQTVVYSLGGNSKASCKFRLLIKQ